MAPDPWPLPEALRVAREVLTGERSVIEGSIELARYAHRMVPDWRTDPDFVIFGAVSSETDHLPFGQVRSRWSPAALAKADAQIEAISERYRTKVRDACANVVARFGVPAGIVKRFVRKFPEGGRHLYSIRRRSDGLFQAYDENLYSGTSQRYEVEDQAISGLFGDIATAEAELLRLRPDIEPEP